MLLSLFLKLPFPYSFKMSKYQMMFGVNLFSCFFTLWSLLNRGKFFPALDFMMRHPDFFMHVVILSITSATGQLFIFHTIETYGPLVFTIIMTTRQVRTAHRVLSTYDKRHSLILRR